MKSALAIQCLPKHTGSKEEGYALVDAAIAVIANSGLPYTVCPFETVVEGPLDELLHILAQAHKAVLEAGAPGVTSYIKLFSAPDLGSTDEKLAKYR